jgi:hypothetical protein
VFEVRESPDSCAWRRPGPALLDRELDAGRIAPVAHRFIQSRQNIGKVVLTT